MPMLIETVAIMISSLASSVLGANLLYLGTYAAIGAGAYGGALLWGDQQ